MTIRFVPSVDPTVGKPFSLLVQISGDNGTGNPIAVVGQKYKINSEQYSILFDLSEKEIIDVGPAPDYLAVIEFESRAGFENEGDQKLILSSLQSPAILEEIAIVVSAAAVATNATSAQPTVAVATSTPVAAPQTMWKWMKKTASDGWKNYGTWLLMILFIAVPIWGFWAYGPKTWISWTLLVACFVGCLIAKQTVKTIGLLVILSLLVAVVVFILAIIYLPQHAIKEMSENGAKAGAPSAPHVEAPQTPAQKIMEKVIHPEPPEAPPPADPTITKDSPKEKAVEETKPQKKKPLPESHKKPKGPYKIPTL